MYYFITTKLKYHFCGRMHIQLAPYPPVAHACPQPRRCAAASACMMHSPALGDVMQAH
jgi:hypothetical protein